MPSRPMLQEPCFGRDSELAEVIDMIFHDGPQPARIAILGPGGYGKTTLASAVLTHERVQKHFGDARYFIACESVSSSGALLTELAKTLGLLDGATDVSWPSISMALNTKDCILCFDNFETPWDQDGKTKSSVEELLSRVARLEHTTLLITMRGIVRPGKTQWTRPFLRPLRTLDCDAARRVWKQTANNYDDYAEELVKAVDCVPLAVSLLAHQAISAELLLKQWNEKHTKFIKRGQGNRQLDLDDSIQLSIDSGRMRASPSAKDLLGVLSMLPDGIHIKQVERFKRILHNMDILSGLSTLQECSLIHKTEESEERYQTLPIIQSFCMNHIMISQKYKNALNDFYINLASTQPDKAQASSYTEMMLEVNNTKATLLGLLDSDFKDYKKLIQAVCTFTMFHATIGDHSDKLISKTVEFLQQKNASTSLLIICLEKWARLHCGAYRFEDAKLRLKEAENLCQASQENKSLLHANILLLLGETHLFRAKFNEAKDPFKMALKFYKHAKDVKGQGNVHKGLGELYINLNMLYEAKNELHEALKFHTHANDAIGEGYDYYRLGHTYYRSDEFQEAEYFINKALDLHISTNSILDQGNDYKALGDIYLKLNKLEKAAAFYCEALKSHKLANDNFSQGCDYGELGHIYFNLSKLNQAKHSFYEALKFHKLTNDHLCQGHVYDGLGDIYFISNQLNKAEDLYWKALKSYKHINDILNQGNTFQKLGRVQMARSQPENAKILFEDALSMHKKAEDFEEQQWDHYFLNEVK